MADQSSSSTKKLGNKVAMITGGASGIGEATARLFANHGARMIVIVDIQDELGQSVAASIGSTRCVYIHCDVTDEEQVKAAVDYTIKSFNQLDIMFSNAGIMSNVVQAKQTILNLDFDIFDRMFSTNVRGMAACVKHAGRAMVELHAKGSIICTASIAASFGGDGCTDYFMSKHAVLGLVKCGSVQLGEHGIRVNCVSPNLLATPMTCRALGIDESVVERLHEERTCLKGKALKMKHVADAVLFLASDESEFVSGHNLVVDGGFSTGLTNVVELSS